MAAGISIRVGRLCVALVLLLVGVRGWAQTVPPPPPERWLFIFGTSSEMKNDLPATEAELKQILAFSISGEMHAGDSVGAWTFDKQLRAGQFPLTMWDPKMAAVISSNLTVFVRKQHYSGKASFDVIQAGLNRVVDNSERLTILIFCDGQADLHFTPYADDINRIFHETHNSRKKAGQPYVIALRTQLGRFAGITVNLPPGELNLPAFPPLELHPKIAPVTAPPPPPVAIPSPPSLPPLIIVGTNVGTNADELPPVPVAAPPPSVRSAPEKVVRSAVQTPPAPTHASPAPVKAQANQEETNGMTQAIISEPVKIAPIPVPAPAVTKTNLPALATVRNDDSGLSPLYILAAVVLIALIILIALLVAKYRRSTPASLITSSMQDDWRKQK
jgi:hypothetical protein